MHRRIALACSACVISLALFYSSSASAQSRYTWYYTSQFTDSRTERYARSNGAETDSNGNPISEDVNYVYLPDHPHSPATLLLFLPGHGSDNDSYTGFLAEAASQGYYVIGLAYRNGQSIQNMCGYWADCPSYMLDQNVSGNYRGFFAGSELAQPPQQPQQAAYNSVNYRLAQLLQYIDQQSLLFLPFQFRQFYNYKTSDVNWSEVVIAGHSEGGSTAAWITKNKAVIAGLTFEAPYTDLDNDYAGPDGQHPGAPAGDPDYSPCDYAGCPFPSSGGVQNKSQFASFLVNDSSNWVDRLYITLNTYDTGYDNMVSVDWCNPDEPGPTSGACVGNPCTSLGFLDGYCETPTWPGVNMWGAARALGKTETQMSSAPSSLGSHKWFTSTVEPMLGARCPGHLATVANTVPTAADPSVYPCYPGWMPAYWDLVLTAALPPPLP